MNVKTLLIFATSFYWNLSIHKNKFSKLYNYETWHQIPEQLLEIFNTVNAEAAGKFT